MENYTSYSVSRHQLLKKQVRMTSKCDSLHTAPCGRAIHDTEPHTTVRLQLNQSFLSRSKMILRGGSWISENGVYLYQDVGVRFADLIES